LIKRDLNVRAAFLHVAGDAAISLSVVVKEVVILYTGWLWIYLVSSLMISLMVIIGTWGLLRESAKLALHAVPADIDADQVKAHLASVDGVAEVHAPHIGG
jgi:cobalt-zinc-cadmium efflux system protein